VPGRKSVRQQKVRHHLDEEKDKSSAWMNLTIYTFVRGGF
jgi:hypothetical protein